MTYGAVSQYLKSCNKPEHSQVHPKFLSCVKEWIKQHNDEPSRVRIHSKQKLQEAATTLEIEKATGSKFKKPKMTPAPYDRTGQSARVDAGPALGIRSWTRLEAHGLSPGLQLFTRS